MIKKRIKTEGFPQRPNEPQVDEGFIDEQALMFVFRSLSIFVW